MAPKPKTLAEQLGARIRALRIEQGLTQERMAWEAGLASKGYLSRIESGQRLPSLQMLQRIAARLGMEIRDLFIFPDRGELDQRMERLRLSAQAKGPSAPPK